MPTVSTTGLYPFDPHGNATTNLINNELQALQSPGPEDYYFIIPQAAPFFVSSLTVRNHADNSTYQEGVDYVIGHYFVEAMNKTGRAIAGSIRFLRHDIAGVVSLTYQTVGGEWGFDDTAVLKELSNKAVNPLVRAWGQIDPLPYSFPPIAHDQSVDDLIGFEDVTDALDRIVTAVNNAATAAASAHETDLTNPHNVTKTQVGLGEVNNYAVATEAEARTGLRSDRYMTPARTKAAFEALSSPLITNHLNDTTNPHDVTKTQVGLGQVANYPVATQAEARAMTAGNRYMTPEQVGYATDQFFDERLLPYFDGRIVNGTNVTKTQIGLGQVANHPVATRAQAVAGSDNDAYMTPLRGFEQVDYHAIAPLNTHVSDTTNPHNVSKAQIGLGDVENHALATVAEAQAGITHDRYMTPLRVSQAVEAQVGVRFDAHLADTTNPHSVTKLQVGLSNVQNYAIANETEARNGSVINRYMTPLRTAQAIEEQALTVIEDHLTDLTNPHKVTQTQVGLGNVDNYPTATQAEAQNGIMTNRFMTPLRTAQAITTQIGTAFTAHVNDKTNPHGVTKTQVGLGSVQNYAIATTTAAVTGTSNTAYMTPLRVKEAINRFAGDDLQDHVDDTTNPHNVTKAQVGLGSVQNYGIATQAAATGGTSNVLYMTPLRTKEAITTQAVTPLNNHKADKTNPHGVTAAQVGAPTLATFNATKSDLTDLVTALRTEFTTAYNAL